MQPVFISCKQDQWVGVPILGGEGAENRAFPAPHESLNAVTLHSGQSSPPGEPLLPVRAGSIVLGGQAGLDSA